MNSKKTGFTMAELLLCIAIIGVVSAMGMTITKKTTEKAYNLYFYTGYINLYNAIADAKSSSDNVTNQQIVEHVKELLSVETQEGGNSQPDETQISIVTNNGIRYFFPTNTNTLTNIPITMLVPKSKNRDGDFNTVMLVYVPSEDGNLIPITNGIAVDLQNRRDLLPAYVDNGFVGRNKNVIDRTNWQYTRPVYGSYKDAFCSIYGVSSNSGTQELINCSTGFTNISAGRTGVLKVADPRKAR